MEDVMQWKNGVYIQNNMKGEVKVFKFIFTAWIETVSLALKFPCVVSVMWRRGEKSSEVKMRREIQKGVATFNEQLQLQCNMNYDEKRQLFEEKKTKFSVLIFSEKGNKQGGVVSLDVAELLNAKQKELKIERILEQCPDKAAKLSLVLKGYLKEEIHSDQVSERSLATAPDQVPVAAPDFKKKKPENLLQSTAVETTAVDTTAVDPNAVDLIKQSNKMPMVPPRAPQNQTLLKLEAEQKRLREQLAEIRQLQLENENLKRKYNENDKKTLTYYTKKLEQAKRQYGELKDKAKQVEELAKKKQQLQEDLCECKDRLGRILNFTIMSKNNKLAQELFSIYQMDTS